MRILELFCGTKSFSKAAEKRGHKCLTIDIENKFNPGILSNIMDVDINILKKFKPDIIWASPPCTQYSHAKRTGVRDIEGSNKIVLKTIEIIEVLRPRYWIIENPQTGLLKDQPFMLDLSFCDASYCQYGYGYRKQTRLWNNFDLILKTCDKKTCNFVVDGKHVLSAGNGRSKYTLRNISKLEKYSLPPKLCDEILRQIENRRIYNILY